MSQQQLIANVLFKELSILSLNVASDRFSGASCVAVRRAPTIGHK